MRDGARHRGLNMNRLAHLIATEQASKRDLEAAGVEAVKLAKYADDLPRFKTNATKPLGVDEDSRTIRYVWSDETVNDYGDIVRTSGWDLSRYSSNPIALWMHDMERPIGVGAGFGTGGGRLTGGIQYAAPGTSPFHDMTWSLAKQGIVTAVSVGFDPLERVWHEDDDKRAALGLGAYGVEIVKSQLLEISLVSIGANPNALREARAQLSAGMSRDVSDSEWSTLFPQATERDWAERARAIRRRTVSLTTPQPDAALIARVTQLEHELRELRTLAVGQRAVVGARERADADTADALAAMDALTRACDSRRALSALDQLTKRAPSA
jgi:hypothetical protein